MKYLFIICLMFSMSASAGIRGVGSGGGYAEMQAILINQSLSQLLQDSLQDKSIAELVALPLRLTISEDCNPNLVRVIGPLQMQISSCALYHEDRALDFSDIAAWVLAARAVYQGLSLEDALVWSRPYFINFTQTEQAVAINLSSGDFTFHSLEIQRGENKSTLLSIEGKSRTYALDSQSLSVALCAGDSVHDMQVQGLSGLSNGAKGIALVQMQWRCGRSTGLLLSGKLQVHFETSAQELIPSSLRLFVTQRR